MIDAISILVNGTYCPIISSFVKNKLTIDLSNFSLAEVAYFDIVISFKDKITAFRNHDYTWLESGEDFVATEFSPKILKIGPNNYIQSNINKGIWEFDKKKPKQLLWRFNPQFAYPLTTYKNKENKKIIIKSNYDFDFSDNPALLFSSENGFEISRSPIPFSAIICFTDHCDFDTADSLARQREFFKSNSIKVTKGFFLNHFSKRDDNASFENDESELQLWKNDGHELAYHSLSQSLKTLEVNISDFYNFEPPNFSVPTWIDHGFQPYNFSLFNNFSISESEFSVNLKSKKIKTLWNYIDSGTSTFGVINQLNSNHFTLKKFRKGNNSIGFINRAGQLLKNIVFHFYADDKIIAKYQKTAASFKEVIYKKKISSLYQFLLAISYLIYPISKIVVFWNHYKNKPYKLAKYTPLFFKHLIGENQFYVFQTLEMIDFKQALHKNNIKNLIEEKGVFIAHTYFSAPMKYHTGKMFHQPHKIDTIVNENFKFLGKKILEKQIWNPTLDELIDYLSNFEKTVLDVDHHGKIIVMNASNLVFRLVQ